MQLFSLLVFYALAALAAVAVADSVHFDPCENSPFIPDSVDVSPYPPKTGGRFTVTVKGKSPYAVDGGKFNYEVSRELKTWFGTTWLPLPGGGGDLCKYTRCPIKKNKLSTLTYSRNLPSILLAGKYKFKVTAEDDKGGKLMCVTLKVDLKSRATQEDILLNRDDEGGFEEITDSYTIAT